MGGEKVGAEQKGAPISGYCGFQAGVSAGNIFGADFVKQQSMAAAHEAALTEAARNATNPIFAGAPPRRHRRQKPPPNAAAPGASCWLLAAGQTRGGGAAGGPCLQLA